MKIGALKQKSKTTVKKTFLYSIFAAALIWALGAAADGGRVMQVVQVNNLEPGGSGATGAAWLKRGNNEIEARIMTDVGMAGYPITIWFLIWADPGSCMNPFYDGEGNLLGLCDPTMGDGALLTAVLNMSGAISASDGDGSGVINVNAHLVAGEEAGGDYCCFGMLPPGKGKTSEIHMVVEKHPLPDKPLSDPFPSTPFSTWQLELTTPKGPPFTIRGAPFLPAIMPNN